MDTTEKKPYETPTIQVYEVDLQQPILMQSPPPKADGYDGWTE